MKLAIALVSSAFALPALAQNLLINGSFEQPALPFAGTSGFTDGQTIGAGWIVESTTATATVIHDAYTGGGAAWPVGSDGNQYLYVGDSLSTSVISQTVNLAGNAQHLLTFDFATFQSPAIDGRLTLDILQGNTSILPGGPVVLDIAWATNQGQFAPQSLSFTTLAPGAYTVRFASTQGIVANVDNFVLVPAPAAAGALLLLARRARRR